MRVPYKIDEKNKLKRMHHNSNEKDVSECISEFLEFKSDQTQKGPKALSSFHDDISTSFKKVYDLGEEVL